MVFLGTMGSVRNYRCRCTAPAVQRHVCQLQEKKGRHKAYSLHRVDDASAIFAVAAAVPAARRLPWRIQSKPICDIRRSANNRLIWPSNRSSSSTLRLPGSRGSPLRAITRPPATRHLRTSRRCKARAPCKL